MAIPATFRERLEQMAQTRSQRLSLLQAEKELQISKSAVLDSKMCSIRSMEQRCLKLDCKIASQHLRVSYLKSQLHCLESFYSKILRQFRVLKNEVEQLEQLEIERGDYYASQSREMEDFRAQVESYIVNCHVQVEQLRAQANELQSSFLKLQSSLNYSNNSEIAEAEMQKSELLCEKESLDRKLFSNFQIKEQLRKQLQTILAEQDQLRKKDAILIKTDV